jgi:hypothetical protein
MGNTMWDKTLCINSMYVLQIFFPFGKPARHLLTGLADPDSVLYVIRKVSRGTPAAKRGRAPCRGTCISTYIYFA